MEDDILSRAVRVTAPAAVAALCNPFRRHLILACVDRERSVSEVAAASGVSLSLAHYHVRRLCRLGLLVETSAQPRRGRAIRKYTARARAFLLPGEDIPGGPLDRELRGALDDARGAASTSLLVYVDSRGAMRMTSIGAGAWRRTAPLDAWHILDLDAAAAAELAGDLERVLQRHERRKPSSSVRRYIVRCAIARRRDDGLFEPGS